MVEVGRLIDAALRDREEASLARIKAQVEELAGRFPLYPEPFGVHRA